MPKIYIAGPMTGRHEHNYPAFHAAAAKLRGDGYTVINPAELHGNDFGKPWDWYLRRDIAALVECDEIALLPGWMNSRGARLEHHVAAMLGMPERAHVVTGAFCPEVSA